MSRKIIKIEFFIMKNMKNIKIDGKKDLEIKFNKNGDMVIKEINNCIIL